MNEQSIYCSKCGAQNQSSARFCSQCATQLATIAPVPVNMAQTPPVAPYPSAISAKAARANKTAGLIIMGFFGFIIFGAFVLSSTDPKNASSPPTSTESESSVMPVATPTWAPSAEQLNQMASFKALEAKQAKEKQQQEIKSQKKRVREAKAALADLRSKRDEVKEITWYFSLSSPKYNNSRSNLHLYFERDDSGNVDNLRLNISFVSDDWLFIERYTVKSDGQTFTIEPTYDEVNRDNGELSNGESGIWEWYDTPASSHLTMLNVIANSKKTILRYEGKQYYRDRVIGTQEKRDIRRMIDTYLLAGGT